MTSPTNFECSPNYKNGTCPPPKFNRRPNACWRCRRCSKMDASPCRCGIAVGYGAEHEQTTKQWFSVHGDCLVSSVCRQTSKSPGAEPIWTMFARESGTEKKIELNFNSRQHFKLSSNLSLFRFFGHSVLGQRVCLLRMTRNTTLLMELMLCWVFMQSYFVF